MKQSSIITKPEPSRLFCSVLEVFTVAFHSHVVLSGDRLCCFVKGIKPMPRFFSLFFFARGYPIFLAIFVERLFFSAKLLLLKISCSYVCRICFWALYSMPLTCFSIFKLILQSLDCCRLIMS